MRTIHFQIEGPVSEIRKRYAHKSYYITTIVCKEDYFRVNDAIQLVNHDGSLNAIFKIKEINKTQDLKYAAIIETIFPIQRNAENYIRTATQAYVAWS